MLATANRRTQVQLGVVEAALVTPSRRLHGEFLRLYDRFVVGEPAAIVDGPASEPWADASRAASSSLIEVHVERQPVSLLHRPRHDVRVGEEVRFQPARRDALLPCVEWSINWEVPSALPQYLHLHASSLEVNGQGVILPGQSGSGKSTLTVGLMRRGWRYLCDEFALVHGETLQLAPFPRAVCIKQPSYAVVERLGVSLAGRPHFMKGSKGFVRFLSPYDLSPDPIGRPCPVRYVIFPTYREGATPTLTPMSRAEAAFAMHRVCFNLFGCEQLGVDVLADLVRGARCYQLVAGEIEATCDLLQGIQNSEL